MSEAISFSLHFLILLLFHFLSFPFSLFSFFLPFFLSFLSFSFFSFFLLIQHFKIPHCGKAAIIPHSTFNLPHL